MHAILILGAGPAGAAVALGLRRLGYPVTLISDWRRFPALEGVSVRVLEALRGAGLEQALAQALQPSQRRVAWNGEEHAQNIEYLLDRPAFDRGLREALREAGVQLIEGRVLGVQSTEAGHRVQVQGQAEQVGEFLVEARGRQAPVLDKGLRQG
ncbi:NAD(P)/FAD-dependent oxidoreductase, partial [Pseudomonas sp. CF161]|uniref:NAD(P)/FAD-dependent oxidoreductase n=1 Tax=Pseudomonas sp. CF161 TaxID=911241 RepID=UPI00035503BC